MRERMSSIDAAWFRIDRPENAADVVALLGFRDLPALSRVQRLLDERLLAYPRFSGRCAGLSREVTPGRKIPLSRSTGIS